MAFDIDIRHPFKSMSNGVGDFFSGIGGAVGGGLLGWKLGDNFGTLGKLAGCVIGAWGGSKVLKEVVADVRGAKQYVDENSSNGILGIGAKDSTVSFCKAVWENIKDVGGQIYDMNTKDSDLEPDV